MVVKVVITKYVIVVANAVLPAKIRIMFEYKSTPFPIQVGRFHIQVGNCPIQVGKLADLT